MHIWASHFSTLPPSAVRGLLRPRSHGPDASLSRFAAGMGFAAPECASWPAAQFYRDLLVEPDPPWPYPPGPRRIKRWINMGV